MQYRRTVTLLLVAIVTTLALVPQPVAQALPSGPVTVRVGYGDDAGLAWLAREEGDVWAVDKQARECTLMTNAAGIEELVARGYEVAVTANAAPEIPACYRTIVQLYADAAAFETQYPGLVQVTDVGDSWDKVMPGGAAGFDMIMIRLTNEAIAGPKPRFFTDGGMHARELPTSELVMEYAEYLLTNYGTNPDVTALLDFSEVYILVNSNPDGHLENELNNSYWRKNMDSNDGCSGSYGVDLNRNQDFKWGCCGGSSGDPCDETYRGPTPASEPEILAYETAVRGLFPDQRGPNDGDVAPITTTGILLSYHNYAAEMLYPWGWTTSASPNAADLRGLAVRYTSFPNRYAVSTALYPVDGNTRDWAYGELGIPAYVIELDSDDFYASCSLLPGIVNENIPAMLNITKMADQPYLRIHGPQANGAIQVSVSGTQATITATVTFAWTGCTTYSPCTNPFSQNVGAAELYIDTPPVRGGTPIAMQAVDGSFNSPTEQVRVTTDISALTSGQHLVFVRGRGVNSYQTLETWGPVTAAFMDVTSAFEYWNYLPLHALNAVQP